MQEALKSVVFSGAGLLALGSASIVSGLLWLDYHEFATKRSKLKTALENIDLKRIEKLGLAEGEKQEKLLDGLEYISDYMKQASDVTGGGETDDHVDRRQIVFDYHGLTRLLAILRRDDLKNNSELLQQALNALFILIKSNTGQEMRRNLASLGGIEILMNIVLSTEYSMEVRGEAAMVLRRATYVDYFKRLYDDEIPYGSENYGRVIAHSPEKLKQMVDLLGSNYRKLEQGIIGVVTHCAHHKQDGAVAMSKAGAVPYLIQNLSNKEKEFYVPAVFGLACIVDEKNGAKSSKCLTNIGLSVTPHTDFKRDADILLSRDTIVAVLNVLKQGEKEKCIKRTTDIIFAIADFLTLKGIFSEEERSNYRSVLTDLMVDHRDATIQIFALISSMNPEAKRKAFRLRSLFTQEKFCKRAKQMQSLVEEADRKVAEEKARKKKQQQQMAQMMGGAGMGGMGGMGIPPEAMTPEMMQMLMTGMM